MGPKRFTFAELDEIRLKENPQVMLEYFSWNYCHLLIERREYEHIQIVDDTGKVLHEFKRKPPKMQIVR